MTEDRTKDRTEAPNPQNPFILIEFAGEENASLRIMPVRVTTAMFNAAAMQMLGAALHNIFQSITQGQVAAAQKQAELESIMRATQRDKK